MLFCEPVCLFVCCTKLCYQWHFLDIQQVIHMYQRILENFSKLLFIYSFDYFSFLLLLVILSFHFLFFPLWFLWFIFPTCYHTSFYPLSFPFFAMQSICSSFIFSARISHIGPFPFTLGRAALQNGCDLGPILSLLFLVSNIYSADQEHYCCCQVIMHRIMPYTYVKGIHKGLQCSVIWVRSCNFI